MITDLHAADLTAIWQADNTDALVAGNAVASAPLTLTLNIGTLPAPDQSRIWTFLEFMHEHSRTQWRLVSHDDADIWVVDWRAESQKPGGSQTRAVVRIIDEHCVAHPETDQITRPLQMADFAALLQRIEVRLGHA